MPRSFGALGLALVLASTAHADETSARFRVTVAVPPAATVGTVGPDHSLVVSDEDVARGFLVVPVRYRVTHNTQRGYLLQIAPRLGLTREVEVRGLGSGVVVQVLPVELQRVGPARVEELALELHVSLDPAVRPGRYALPVHLSAVAL